MFHCSFDTMGRCRVLLMKWRNQIKTLLVSFLGKLFLPLSIPYLFTVLCVGLGPHTHSPIRVSVFIGIVHVQPVLRQSCWWKYMGVASNIPRRDNLTTNSLFLWLLESFLLLCNDPWVLDARVVLEMLWFGTEIPLCILNLTHLYPTFIGTDWVLSRWCFLVVLFIFCSLLATLLHDSMFFSRDVFWLHVFFYVSNIFYMFLFCS